MYIFNKICLGIIHYFQHFCKSTESTLGGRGVNPVVHFQKCLVLASVSVHETSLANQHFYSTLLGRREGVCKKSTLCTFVKMLKIIDDLLHVTIYSKTFEGELSCL